MIGLHKMLSAERGEHVECSTVAEALGAMDAESKYIIARVDSDEEFLGLLSSVLKRSQYAVEVGAGDTVWVWTVQMQMADGPGWRLCFEQQQALTAQGQAKMQAAQQQQARQMMGAMGIKPNGGLRRG